VRPFDSTLRDYREASAAFSRPARLFLACTALAWAGFGVNQVLFNLYLVEAGFGEAFVGHAVAWNGIGLAVAALPAGLLADRWGRRRSLMLGAVLEGPSLLARTSLLSPAVVFGGSFLAGAGQSLLAIAAAPFLTEHSTPRERTHLFSAFFACELLAGVGGNLIGGWVPAGLTHLPAVSPDVFHAYRITLVLGALIQLASALPLAALRGLREAPLSRAKDPAHPRARRLLWPIAINAFFIGAGAGLVIPFMNLYFRSRFACSSAQIGMFFSLAQVSTALAALLVPALARRFGKLRTATASQLLSLPFLVTLGAERHLAVAVTAFWLRATLMQASIPLIGAFVMEALPPALRARSTSLNNLVWNGGWAVSATLSGLLIQRFGYAVPFYVTASLYAAAAAWFYLSFRGAPEPGSEPYLPEEAKGLRGEGPMTE
jgi:MFS family permease